MLKSQAATLNETGLELLEKAKQVGKVSDAKTYTELGFKCLAEARDILAEMKSNSILIFFECCAHKNVSFVGWYDAYLDFCARNGLEILSEEDFDNLAKDILPD